MIGAARLALSLATLGTLLDGTESTEHLKRAAPVVAGLFAAYSGGLLAWLFSRRRLPHFAGALLLCTDLIWFSALVFVGGYENNPYPILYVFILLSAGLRWGMRETLVCAGICSMFATLFPLALAKLDLHYTFSGAAADFLPPVTQFDFDTMLMRTAALLVIGYLIGYLSEREKRIQRGMAELAHALTGARVDRDLSDVVGQALASVRDLYRARSVTALFYDFDEDDLIRFSVRGRANNLSLSEITDSEVSRWVDLEQPHVLPDTLSQELGTARFHWTHFAYQGHLGWLFIEEPRVKNFDPAALQYVADELGPVLEKMFLLRRVRQEAIDEERSRIARDFHDGPLQSFYSFELYLEVLQRLLESDPKRAAEELASLRESARRSGLELREFVQNMRPIDVEAATLLSQVRTLADDFQKSSKFKVTVLAESHRIRARRKLGREILQMIRESLNNIRKHAEASHAVITLEQEPDWLTLTVDDDGRGFSFEGEYDLETLDRLRLGPISIKQRARSIGAQLSVTSHRNHGSKLVVRVPLTPTAQDSVEMAGLAAKAG